MNFETDELNFKKELWTIKCRKLTTDWDTKMRYDSSEDKDKNKGNRLVSDYVNVLFDEGVEFGLINSGSRRKKKKGKEVNASRIEQ